MKETDLNILNKYRAAIMGVAAIWIFIFHEQELEWTKVFFSPEFLSKAFYFIKRVGYCGVEMFLMLSGIGLVYAREKHSLAAFYIRRTERVFIPFFMVALIRMILERWSFSDFLKKVFFYNFFFVRMNEFLWFVPAILILYMFFPLYYRFFKKSGNKYLFTLSACAIWLCLSLLAKGTMRGDMYGFTNRIPIFLVGILLGWMLREKSTKIAWHGWLLLLFSFLAGLILAHLTIYKKMYLLLPDSNSCIPTFLLAFSSTFFAAKFFSIINSLCIGKWLIRILSFFGSISLEIYILQEWLDKLIRPLFMSSYENWIANFIWINLAIAVVIIFMAFILHYICDKICKLISRHIFPNMLKA